MITPDWIAVDWGTTNLRVWAMTADGQVLDKRHSEDGMSGLTRSEFEPALLKLINDWLGVAGVPVLCCGMVGSRQGWVEAPYRTAPCTPLAPAPTRAQAKDPRLNVHVIRGIKQLNPADVMRGEETQIAGLLSVTSDFDGVVCLPGTHTKWVQVVDGEIVRFTTFMTGELFALLSQKSVLRHFTDATGWDEASFLSAINNTMTNPANLAAYLFSLRAESLIGDLGSPTARARLSGLLIGLELGAAQGFWRDGNVVILGENGLAKTYLSALNSQNAKARTVAHQNLTLAGLSVAFSELEAVS